MTGGEMVVSPAARVLFTALPDGGVLLDLETKVYFTLNVTGAALWACIVRGGQSRDTLVKHLAVHFEVDVETADRDVDAWVDALAAEGLVDVRR